MNRARDACLERVIALLAEAAEDYRRRHPEDAERLIEWAREHLDPVRQAPGDRPEKEAA